MKIRTKLIISFLLILIVPVCLTLVAVSGFSRIQQKAIANKYGIPVNELAMPISMLILILSFIILAEIFEKDMLKIKSNKKQKNT